MVLGVPIFKHFRVHILIKVSAVSQIFFFGPGLYVLLAEIP